MNRICQSQLVARARRDLLSDPERLALDAHLATCASCRVDRRIMLDFDDMPSVDIRDGARIQTLAATARDWTRHTAAARGRRAFARRPAFRIAAASVLLLAGTASAAVWWSHRPAPPAPPAPAPSASASAWASSSAPSITPTPTLTPTSNLAPAPAPAPTDPPSAAALLRRAGAARRSGDAATAIALYRRLQRDFAGTPEASLAAVPLAALLYDRGAPRAALALLDAYLAAAPGGALRPEAMFDRARALSALGAGDAERRAWLRLLDEYPDSAYARLARRRLEAQDK